MINTANSKLFIEGQTIYSQEEGYSSIQTVFHCAPGDTPIHAEWENEDCIITMEDGRVYCCPAPNYGTLQRIS